MPRAKKSKCYICKYMEGFFGLKPVIKKLSFEKRGFITFHLMDGRIIHSPLSRFPSIQKLTLPQRKKWQILDDQLFTWNDCNEVFHIEQVLGKESEYKYGHVV